MSKFSEDAAKISLKKNLICPRCDAEADAIIMKAWGKTVEQGLERPLQPYICSWCGSLSLLDMGHMSIIPVPDDLLWIIQTNKVLWDSIQKARDTVLSLQPNPRPILR